MAGTLKIRVSSVQKLSLWRLNNTRRVQGPKRPRSSRRSTRKEQIFSVPTKIFRHVICGKTVVTSSVSPRSFFSPAAVIIPFFSPPYHDTISLNGHSFYAPRPRRIRVPRSFPVSTSQSTPSLTRQRNFLLKHWNLPGQARARPGSSATNGQA